MKKRIAVTAGLLMGISMLAGCAETPETPIVRPKGENAMEQYREAEHPGPQDAGQIRGRPLPESPSGQGWRRRSIMRARCGMPQES